MTSYNFLKVELKKESHPNAYFKIMPRFKVRFEGEEVFDFMILFIDSQTIWSLQDY